MQGETKVTIDKAATLAAAGELLVEPMSPTSLVFVRELDTHIVVIVGLDSPINVEVMKAQIPLALNHPRFSSLMVEGEKEEWKWVQIPRVNIDDHLIVPEINHTALSNNLVAADTFVEDYLHTLSNTSLDTSKPPWEIHLVNVRTSEAESLAIIRIHHSLGDGISITSHILAWTRQLANPNALPTIATMNKKKKKETIKINDKHRCWELPWNFILAVWWWIQVLCNTVIDVLMFLATSIFLKDSYTLTLACPKTNTKQRRFVYKTVSLDDMKLIKNAMRVTINDVVIGIVEAGLSRYLIRRLGNDNTKEEKDSKNMLKKIRMRIAIPVNQRPITRIQGLEDIKNKNTELRLGNQLGFVIAPLSIKSRDDPLEYVRNAKNTVDRKKRSLEAKANYLACELAMKVFGLKIAASMAVKMFKHVSILVSNLPGPVEETIAFGHPVKFIAPTSYDFPSPILIHLQSCTNKMTICVSVREDIMIDPHELHDDIVQSFTLIRDAVMSNERGLPS